VVVRFGPADGDEEPPTETFYYKFGDGGTYDLTSNTNPKHYIMDAWLETLRKFVLTALLEYVRDPKQNSVISPCCVVKKMLFVEWGSAGDEFTLLLCRASITPDRIFENIVTEEWKKIVRLPVPRAFAFATQDRVAQECVIAFAG